MDEKMTGTCEECGEACWTDAERNYEDFEAGNYEGGMAGQPLNPGRAYWEDAHEERGIDRDALLCAGCLNEVHAIAWKIRERDDS